MKKIFLGLMLILSLPMLAFTEESLTRLFRGDKDLSNADFSSLDFANTKLEKYRDFSGKNLSWAKFIDCILFRCIFTRANLLNTDFTGASLLESVFTSFTNTSKFMQARQDGKDDTAIINETKFCGARFMNAKYNSDIFIGYTRDAVFCGDN